MNQRLLVRLLEKEGHAVTIVEDGESAVELSRERKFDGILMDVQMPKMDGLHATCLIRAREQATGGHIPIIALTAHAMKGDRERCMKAGMDRYIAKPIDKQELLRALEICFPAEDRSGLSSSSVCEPSSERPPDSVGCEANAELAVSV
jgi:CheY-like chemotaxis protein